jgi:hypothetical protein
MGKIACQGYNSPIPNYFSGVSVLLNSTLRLVSSGFQSGGTVTWNKDADERALARVGG